MLSGGLDRRALLVFAIVNCDSRELFGIGDGNGVRRLDPGGWLMFVVDDKLLICCVERNNMFHWVARISVSVGIRS